MKGAFRFPMIAGGNPDPAIYCPTEGFYDPDDPDSPVIWNPINPDDGWFLIAELQTNSPNSTTFDPTIIGSGQFAWDLGDGTYLIGDKAVSHTYLTTATRTVKLYGKGTCTITSIDFSGDNIVGELDLSHSAFASCLVWSLYTNIEMTSVLFPSSLSGQVQSVSIWGTGINNNLDLSSFTTFNTSGSIQIYNNTSMTGITFASSISGTISVLNIYGNTSLSGTLDLSKFTTFTTSATLQILSNTSMTGITFASSITGTFGTLYIYSNTSLSGTLDLSKFTTFGTSADVRIYGNTSMTGITFASSITGTISRLFIYSNGLTGTLDLSKFTTFTTTAMIIIFGNNSMAGITFASSITGTFSELSIYNNTSLSGTLDLSKFTTWTTTATLNIYGNTSMTGITFPASTITGFIRTLRLDGNTSLGYVDLTKLRTGVASLNWKFDNNGWSAAIVNQVLVNIAGISAAGFSGRTINIGGTNADPDTTSGGYNGTAARTTLQGYSFTVTIT